MRLARGTMRASGAPRQEGSAATGAGTIAKLGEMLARDPALVPNAFVFVQAGPLRPESPALVDHDGPYDPDHVPDHVPEPAKDRGRGRERRDGDGRWRA